MSDAQEWRCPDCGHQLRGPEDIRICIECKCCQHCIHCGDQHRRTCHKRMRRQREAADYLRGASP